GDAGRGRSEVARGRRERAARQRERLETARAEEGERGGEAMSPGRRPSSSGRLSADEIVSPAGPNVPFPPQEALLVEKMPSGPTIWYEPKWEGFRGVCENDGGEHGLWSRNGRPLLRYFPELRPLGERMPPHSALDGEIVIERGGRLDFDAMHMRLPPAESRVRMLAGKIPAQFIVFDVLLWKGKPVHEQPLEKRRAALEKLPFTISPATRDLKTAAKWLDRFEAAGLDGVIAKRLGRA